MGTAIALAIGVCAFALLVAAIVWRPSASAHRVRPARERRIRRRVALGGAAYSLALGTVALLDPWGWGSLVTALVAGASLYVVFELILLTMALVHWRRKRARPHP